MPDAQPDWLAPASTTPTPAWLDPASTPTSGSHPDWLMPTSATPPHEPRDRASIQSTIRRTAQQYGVPESVALGVAQMESNFDPHAKSKAGALGVMQLMPETAKGLGVDPTIPEQNIAGGVRYLDQMYRRYRNWEQALAAYNAGPGAVDKAIRDVQFDEAAALRLGGATTQKRTWLDYLPAETRSYVRGLTPFLEGRAADRPSSPAGLSGTYASRQPARQVPPPHPSWLQRAETTVANLPGIKQAGDVARSAGRLEADLRQHSPFALSVPNGQVIYGAGGRGSTAQNAAGPEVLFPNPLEAVAPVFRFGEDLLTPVQRAGAEAEAVARTLPASRAARVVPSYAPGAIAPGARAAIDLQQQIDAYLARTQDLRGYMGSVDETIRRAALDKTAANLEANRMVRTIRGTPGEEAAAYRLFEHPGELPTASPLVRQIVNRLQPIKDATDRMKAELRAIDPAMAPEVTPGPYIHRIAVGKPGNMLERAKQAMQRGGGGFSNVLGAAVPSSFKKAEMQALVGDDGSRFVAHIGRRTLTDAEKVAGADTPRSMVTVFEHGQAVRSFPYRTTTRGHLLERALRPYRLDVMKLRAAIAALRLSPTATPERLQALRIAVQQVEGRIVDAAQTLQPFSILQDRARLKDALDALQSSVGSPSRAEALKDALQRVALDLVNALAEYTAAERTQIARQSAILRRAMTQVGRGPGALPEIEQAIRSVDQVLETLPRLSRGLINQSGKLRRVMGRLDQGQAALPELKGLLNDTNAAIKNIIARTPNPQEQVVQELARVHRGKRDLWLPTGRVFRMARATTDEIERESGVRYYKSATASVVSDYVDTLNKWRQVQTLERLKTDPRFLKYATRDPIAAGKDWRQSQLPQFRGWYMHPDVRAAFDRAQREIAGGDDPGNVFQRLTNAYVTMVFLNPLAHWPNMGTQALLFESGRMWLAPREWSALFSGIVRGFNTAAHMGEDYETFLRAGANMMRIKQVMRPLGEELLRTVGDHVERDPQGILGGLGQALGLNPADIAKGFYSGIQQATWFVHDWLTSAMTYQVMEADRVPMDEALKRVSRFFVEYAVPTQGFGVPGAVGRGISAVATNRTTTLFGRWHYGALAALGRTFADGAKAVYPLSRMSMAERIGAAQRLVALYALTVLAPQWYSELGQQITGNPTTYSPGAGSAAYLASGLNVASGKETPSGLTRRIITPIPGVIAFVGAIEGRDPFTGKSIYDESAPPAQKIEEFATYLGVESIFPYRHLIDSVRNGRMTAEEAMLQMVHLYSPSLGAWGGRALAIKLQVRQKQFQVNLLYAQGHAPDAQRLIHETNDALFQALRHAAHDAHVSRSDSQLRVQVWGTRKVRGLGLHAPSPREIATAHRQSGPQPPGAALLRLLIPPTPHRGFAGLRLGP